ncbi:hypothetical protein DSO57_1019218 [Entomophthora muscae]|uniref:Uncharacterized protein n=1 Tax=Entomophthora muscae TaxID=34485 RepID=A0ACC2SSX1_9FUNG|nr:hypothetical protein DSO57_1019218 [Entomophthora muscae]
MFKPAVKGLLTKLAQPKHLRSTFKVNGEAKGYASEPLVAKQLLQPRSKIDSSPDHFPIHFGSNHSETSEKRQFTETPSCERVLKNMFLVTYEKQHELSRAFLRFQEFYESPVFRQKYFTLDEFKSWYIRKFGKFTYETDWIGFNIPSTVFEEFESGKMNPLSSEEIKLLDIVSTKPKPFYIIGSTSSILGRPADNLGFIEPCHREKLSLGTKSQELSATLIHEMSHGLFYLDSKYSNGVMQEVSSMGVEINPLFQIFYQLGYHKEVWIDEAAAYLISECASHPVLSLNGIDINTQPWSELRAKLQHLFSTACDDNLRAQS